MSNGMLLKLICSAVGGGFVAELQSEGDICLK